MRPTTDDAGSEDSTQCTAFGVVASTIDIDALARRLQAHGLPAAVRESAHVVGGSYVRVTQGDTLLSIEQASPTEWILRGDAPVLAALIDSCAQLSGALRDAGLEHSIEIYDANDDLVQVLSVADL